ncbi:MAG: hypothetical protein GY854_25475 [Deltaproteobacteria bacterium]|nr:hypothetical protein [Deltaproteobacteria bacterium]
MKKRTVIILIAGIVSVFVAFGCGGAKNKDETKTSANANMSSLEGAPAWVTKDCRQIFVGTPQAGSMVCGVGSVSGMTDRSLARQAATGRGRTEIASFLQLRIKSMLKDYQKAESNPDGSFSSETEIENVSKQITDITLNGTRMIESWMSPTGEYFALVVLSVEDFSSAIESSTGLDENIRTTVLEGAPKLFSELDAEGGYY